MLGFGIGVNAIQQGHRLGGSASGTPVWLPEGAVAGVNYQEGEAWLFDTLITDLSDIHGNGTAGSFDPTAITAAGMAVTYANTNRPAATNQLADVFLANDWCVVIDWDHLDLTSATFLYTDDGDPTYNYINAQTTGDESGGVMWCDGANGNFSIVGTITGNTRNKLAASANSNGWLTSVNGQTAVLDAPVTPALINPPLRVFIGTDYSSFAVLNGTLRSIIFYPNEQSAAAVEALATI